MIFTIIFCRYDLLPCTVYSIGPNNIQGCCFRASEPSLLSHHFTRLRISPHVKADVIASPFYGCRKCSGKINNPQDKAQRTAQLTSYKKLWSWSDLLPYYSYRPQLVMDACIYAYAASHGVIASRGCFHIALQIVSFPIFHKQRPCVYPELQPLYLC